MGQMDYVDAESLAKILEGRQVKIPVFWTDVYACITHADAERVRSTLEGHIRVLYGEHSAMILDTHDGWYDSGIWPQNKYRE